MKERKQLGKSKIKKERGCVRKSEKKWRRGEDAFRASILFISVYNLSFNAYMSCRLIFVKLQKKPLNL